MPYRVGVYCRTSTSDQRCEMQLRELREYVSRQPGWEIFNEYVDSGFSGTKASRPALDSLMKDASKKKFNAVAVWKLDRFGRSVLNLSQSLDALDFYGVRFISHHARAGHRFIESSHQPLTFEHTFQRCRL